MPAPIISLIAAVDRNLAIGRDNAMPWHLPDDFKYFKQQTMGKPVVMGRKTFESIGGRPLPGRRNYILSRQSNLQLPGVEVFHEMASLLQALQAEEEVMIMGGEQIYRQFLPLAHRLYLTEVATEIDADAHFPSFDQTQWQEISRQPHPKDARHAFDFDFVQYQRQMS